MISVDKGKEYKTMSLGLDRIKSFLSDQNIVYEKLKYIHIAGTNGKGSTAKMLSEILKNCGYKTGLYTSPHLVKINERIRINSVNISDKDFVQINKKYGRQFKKYKLTYFEIITAIAFIYFIQKKVDVVVLETGLGGRFDATNIVIPIISVITSIGLDHTEILGKSLKKIAFEKAGIIKETVPVVCGKIDNAALNVICKTAGNKNSKVFVFGKDFVAEHLKYDWKNYTQTVEYKSSNNKIKFSLSLLGRAQIYNSAVVLNVCEILKNKLNKINFSVIKKTLKNIRWSARFDIRKIKITDKKCSLIIDGAHNEQAVENFLNLYKHSPFYKKDNKLCFALMQEKNYKKVVKLLAKDFKDISLIELENSRALGTKVLKKEFVKYIDEKNIKIYGSVKEVFADIKNNDNLIFVGSFFLAGEVIKTVETSRS